MSKLKSILGLLAMGTVLKENPISQGLVAKVLRTLVSVIVTCMLFVALVVAGFVSLFLYLVDAGHSNVEASLYVLGGLAGLLVIGVFAMCYAMKHLKFFIRTNVKTPVPMTAHLVNEANTVVKSFIDGLLNRGR